MRAVRLPFLELLVAEEPSIRGGNALVPSQERSRREGDVFQDWLLSSAVRQQKAQLSEPMLKMRKADLKSRQRRFQEACEVKERLSLARSCPASVPRLLRV